jgi:chromosomal replication initiator protein
MLDTIWRGARHRLRRELSGKDYEAWIEPLRAVAWSPGELTLEAPSGFFREWVRRHFLAALAGAVGEASGKPASVSVVVNRSLDVPARTPRAREAGPVAAPPPAVHTFENFVVGVSNQVAFGAAQSVVARPGERFNPLFVFGGVGMGKTHLLGAVAIGVANARGAAAVAHVSAEEFVNQMVNGLKTGRMARFRNRFRSIETLVVDDIQFLSGKKRSQEEFQHTFNALRESRRQIVIASDRAPHDMPGLESTLRSRFASGLLARIEAPDPELRLALVRRKATALGLAFEPPVEQYLADEWCPNVRDLEGALLRLEAYSTLAGGDLTLAGVRHALGRSPAASGRPTIERVIGEVCHDFELSRAEIISPRRTARVALPRQVAMYLCREHTDAPLSKIGAEFGGRDHSTVVHALGAIERRVREDAELRQRLSALRARLGA